MMLALKRSPESKELIDLATKYLRGVKGTLVQQKKREREKALANAQTTSTDPSSMPMTTGPGASISRPLPGQYYAPHPAQQPSIHAVPMQQAPMYPGSASAEAGGSNGPAVSAQQAQAFAQHRQAQDMQKRFNEHEAERALQEFLKGSR
jgi:chromodomain-helicase-DNA-binding protein 4